MPDKITAVFMIPPKVHLLDITGPAHIFYEAACYGAPVRALYSTMFPGHTGEESSCALAFHQLIPYNELQLKAGDLVFIPGLDSALLLDVGFMDSSRAFQYWLKAMHARGVLICSVCTGAFLVAESGLLDGLSCTTHWKYADRFKSRFPQVNLLSNRLFVAEAGIYTSAGVASGIDLALYLTEVLWGAAFAAQVAKEVVVYFRRGEADPQLSVFTQYRNHMEERVHRVQDRLAQQLDKKQPVETLAELVSMSPRNLTRLFRKTTGITIGEYQDRLRTERAAVLLGDGHTYQSAALHVGLKSTSRLRELLNER